MNRSFALMATEVVQQSNTTSGELNRVMTSLGTFDRLNLASNLQTLDQQAQIQSSLAAFIEQPVPPADPQRQFDAVFAQRASAVRSIVDSIDQLLGLPPQGNLAQSVRTPTLITIGAATNQVAQAGKLLMRSDLAYRALRHALRRSAGHATLPASVWIPNNSRWQTSDVSVELNFALDAPSLAVQHTVVILTTRLTPPALPPPNGILIAGVSTITPTRSISLSIVVGNTGSVAESRVTVQVSLSPTNPGAPPVSETRSIKLLPGRSAVLPNYEFAVAPGHDYVMTSMILSPTGQTPSVTAPESWTLRVAPAV
jgi:hypothetical protein